MSLTGGATSDVDTATLLRAMPERDQAIVRDAWRHAEPASTDGVTAAVAINRIRKQRRFLWVMAMGWSAFALLSVATLGTDSVPRMVATLAAAALAAGIAAWAWFALVRSRRNLSRLEQVADPDAAAERARGLRSGRSSGTSS